ncbi:MAG TPA: peptidylprolyl isomerase [Allocoleopsis sp.]
MTVQLELAHCVFTSEELIPLLSQYNLIPQLLCEIIVDQAIASITCDPQEIEQACQSFYQRWQLNSAEKQQAWRSKYGLNQQQFQALATRTLRVEKFKQMTWGQQLSSYFLERKHLLDRVVYSMIRVKEERVANELYFRLTAGEATFAELALQYSQGPEATTGGLVGSIEVGSLHPALVDFFYALPLREVQSPVFLSGWWLIVQIEQVIAAEWNDEMRQRLLQEKFEQWFKGQLQQLSYQDQVWMGGASFQSEERQSLELAA